MSHCYDRHTLYVETGIAHRDQIENCFKIPIRKLRIPCRFKVNLVSNRNGYCGYAYIWVSSTQVYNAILGKNLDGTDRIVYENDPNWSPPEKSLEEAIHELKVEFSDPDVKGVSGSWCDMVDAEDEINQQYECPKIKHDQSPLVKVPGYTYDEGQILYLRGRAIENSEDTDTIPDMGYFEIAPACVPEIDDRYTHNVIVSRRVPDWITENILKNLFVNYASDSTTIHRRNVRGRNKVDTYPHIGTSVRDDVRSVYVTFDPSTADARFALLMTRKLLVVDRSGDHDDVTLVFNHSYS